LGTRGKVPLTRKEISVTAKEVLASLFGQPLVLAKVIPSEVSDHDATRLFVVLLLTKRPLKIEVGQSYRLLRTLRIGLDEPKATKAVTLFEPIFNFQMPPISLWNFDGPSLTRQLLRLFCELAVEVGQNPKEPSVSRTIISGKVLPLYLPNSTGVQCMSVTSF
jgi:hypothetical protein